MGSPRTNSGLEVELSKSPRRFTTEQVNEALIALAVHRGSATLAEAALREHGTVQLAHDQIRSIKRSYKDEYAAIVAKVAPQLEQEMAEGAARLAAKAEELESKLVTKLSEAVDQDELPKRDLANALRNVSVTKGLNLDKYLGLTGKAAPSAVEGKDVTTLMNALARDFKGAVKVRAAIEIETQEQ